MRLLTAMVLASLATAQTPSLSGVWKADLSASQFPGGHGPTQFLEIISQSGVKITEQSGSWMPFGVSRSQLVFTSDGSPTIGNYDGVPSRAIAQSNGTNLSVSIETDGQPESATRNYELSSDGKQLTISIVSTHDGHAMRTKLVLVKQDDAAGAPLRETPAAAATTFKNLKTPLKNLNTEQFIDTMHYFSWALNKNCSFCHVERDFASDDKDEKRTAREMISMTNGVNRDTFHGKQQVTCFTCHEFHNHPFKRPLFPGEKPHEEHEHAHEHHETAGQ